MTAVKTLTTVRHSTTAHNAAHVISGRLDEPLSDDGRALARELRELLGPLSADSVVSSPMRRALETAAIVTSAAAAEIVTSDLCVERSYGVLEGVPPDEVATYADRITYIERGGIRHSLNPPGGESFEEVRARADATLGLIRSLPAKSVVLVAHQTFLQQLQGLLTGLDVHDALALDVRTLQVDRFELNGTGPFRHEAVHPGMGIHRSW
jgi:probable phosphoglycerate mutase